VIKLGHHVLRKHLSSVCAGSCDQNDVVLLQRAGVDLQLLQLSQVKPSDTLPSKIEQ
jgi:hypothetical protein